MRRVPGRGRSWSPSGGSVWSSWPPGDTRAHCTVLYCTVLYCTVLYCREVSHPGQNWYRTEARVMRGLVIRPSVEARLASMLQGDIRYCTVLYCTVLYCTVLYCIVLHYTVLYWL